MGRCRRPASSGWGLVLPLPVTDSIGVGAPDHANPSHRAPRFVDVLLSFRGSLFSCEPLSRAACTDVRLDDGYL